MPKLFKTTKPAFPRERYERRNQSVNRYWDAEDARRSRSGKAALVRPRSAEPRPAPKLVQVKMTRPARVVRPRKQRIRKKLTPRQILRLVINSLIGVGVVCAALFFVFVFPNLPPILNLRAARALENEEPDRAKALYLRSVEGDPSDTDTILLYADLIDDGGDVNRVIDFLSEWDNGDPRIGAMLSDLRPDLKAEPLPGAYTDFRQITLSSPRSDVTIHYTTDGTPVSPESPVYTGPFWLPEGVTEVQALGVAENDARSQVLSGDYTVSLRQPEAVTSSEEPGVYDHTIRVLLNAGAGDLIRYTTDGSAPTVNSLLYKAPEEGSEEGGFLLKSGVTTIRAISVTPQGAVSGESAFTYDLSAVLPEPVSFDLEGGYFYGALVIHLSTNRDDCLIYFTTNGLEPVPDSYYTYLYEDELVLDVGFNAPITAVAVTPQGVYSDLSVEGYTVRAG